MMRGSIRRRFPAETPDVTSHVIGKRLKDFGADTRTLRELRDQVIANKELIARTWNDHFA